MNEARKKKLLWVIAGVLGLSLVVGLVLFALQEQVDHYYSPTQIADGVAPKAKRIRAGGVVVRGSVMRDKRNPMLVSFQITDYAATTKVSYEGILPDLFKEESGIVATGKVLNDTFVAETVLAKHDENYMPPEVANSLKKPEAIAHKKPNLNY